MRKLIIGVAVLLAVLILLPSVLFTTSKAEQALVLQFGEVAQKVDTDGPHLKLPFIQSVQVFPKGSMMYETHPNDVVLKDKKTLSVDNVVEWRIVDSVAFLKSLGTVAGAQIRIDDLVYSELRNQLGLYDMQDVVSGERGELMATVKENANKRASAFGIEIIDVRIKMANLPPENTKAVYERMKSERNKQATQYRSEGQEQATKIQAETAKQKEIILADAYKQAQEIKGQGDAESIRIYNNALGQDPEFYTFVRTLQTYENGFKPGTRLVLTPDSPLLRYLENPN